MQNNNPGPATNEMIILPIDVSFQLNNPPYESDSGTMDGAPALLGTKLILLAPLFGLESN